MKIRRLIAKKPKLLETKKEILWLVFANQKLFKLREKKVYYSIRPDRYFTVATVDYQYIVRYYSRNRHIIDWIDIKTFDFLDVTGYEWWDKLGAKKIRVLLKTIQELAPNSN